jgi:hypothetical protein
MAGNNGFIEVGGVGEVAREDGHGLRDHYVQNKMVSEGGGGQGHGRSYPSLRAVFRIHDILVWILTCV